MLFHVLATVYFLPFAEMSSVESVRLKTDLASGKLKLIPRVAQKSEVWKKFLQLVDANTLSPAGYVQCKDCKGFSATMVGKQEHLT